MLGPGIPSGGRRKSDSASDSRSTSGKGKIQVVEEENEDDDDFEEIPDEEIVPEDDLLTAGVDAKLGELAKQQALGQDSQGGSGGVYAGVVTPDPVTPVDDDVAVASTGLSTPLRPAPSADAETLKALEKAN